MKKLCILIIYTAAAAGLNATGLNATGLIAAAADRQVSVTRKAQGCRDTIYVADYGIRPDTYSDCVPALRAAIDDCRRQNAKVLVFDEGRYDFWPDDAVRREFFITNTSTEEECPSKVKTFGLFFENINGLAIEGNGAGLVFHGKMTMLSLVHCGQVTLRNLTFDFERPGGSEMTYTAAGEDGVDVVMHPDSKYAIVDGRLRLVGEGWRTEIPHCIEYDPSDEHFFFSGGWDVLSKAETVETGPGRIHFRTTGEFHPVVGNTLTVRDIIRDQVGMFIYESRDVRFENVAVRYMHGLGIVSQYSRNITMDRVQCAPEEGSGRLLASSADFMHFSGCSGRIRILNCNFAGAQDDPVNVHGTNLRAVRKVSARKLVLRFMHGQSYGYNAFFKGDTVAFVHAASMERFAGAAVRKVKRLSDREVLVTFDRSVPESLAIGHDCVENMSCTPEVEIRGCRFTRTSTRGTLVTTPRKVVIADNVYYKTGMSAILIEGDAEGWYESGPVKDVLITGNTFVDCAYNGGPANAAIALNPSNTVIDPDRPVHTNVRIVGNRFVIAGRPVLYAKSTSGLVFKDNTVILQEGTPAPDHYFILNACQDVDIRSNTLPE